jgi:hypothetical protein
MFVHILQLYAQANGVNFFLKEKVKEWALASGGLLPSVATCPSQFLRWNEIVGTEHENGVAWCGLKSPQRAMEKLHRAYDGDVSRLVDICRQIIVFEHMDGLLKCLYTIFRDSDVEIDSIKNHLDDEYDSEATAGYRYVCMCRHRIYVCVRVDVKVSL